MEFLKQLNKKNISSIFSEILEQSAITVAVSHPNTLKHCIAADLGYFYQLNRTKLGYDVI